MTKQMQNLIRLEEAGQFALSIILFGQTGYDWWVFPAFLLLPDISMAGYLAGSRAGAWLYNLIHHKGLAISILALGYILHIPLLCCSGAILFGHSAMDRIFGYGLKYADSFHNTHLGKIGREA